MTGLNHGMTGAVIALVVKNPAAAVPLAFLSHFVQDMIPHWDYGVRRVGDPNGNFFTRRFNLSLLADFLLSVGMMILLAFLFPAHKWLIWGCMVAAASPDLMWAYYRLYRQHIKRGKVIHLDPLARLHAKIQWSQTGAGLIVEILWFISTGAIILNLR